MMLAGLSVYSNMTTKSCGFVHVHTVMTGIY